MIPDWMSDQYESLKDTVGKSGDAEWDCLLDNDPVSGLIVLNVIIVLCHVRETSCS